MASLEQQSNTLKFLCADMVQQANSGHPWAPMWLSDIITVLKNHLRHDPKNLKWLNRDRLVFSWWHASSLVYSFLHLSGYDISLDDLKKFRQLWSKTPWHPEYGEVPWVEITTWPLGQWVANAVWFSLASKYAKNILSEDIINHNVYCFCGDGDLQEGISYEASSIAGNQKLDNLIIIYDSNAITIEGSIDLSFNEDVEQRFMSQWWNVESIDGHNFEEINQAIENWKKSDKPYLIIAHTKIGKWSIAKEGTCKAHGEPLWVDDLRASKKAAWFDPEKSFVVNDDVRREFEKAVTVGNADLHPLLEQLQNPDFSKIQWPEFEINSWIATRNSNGEIMNAISKAVPWFLGWSADLSPSTKTNLNGEGIFPNGKNMYFGIREHAMWAICNAISLYGLFIPFSATFFVFSDYMKAAARIAALVSLKHYFIWTHDSIWVGEDWPTHQPIEQLSQFRALPNFYNFRPATAYENIECWKIALEMNAPCSFIGSRQNLKNYKYSPIIWWVEKGAYLVKSVKNPRITLLASGSELELALNSAESLEKKWIWVNVVSMPCFDLLVEQDKEYIDSILDFSTIVIWIEASRGLELYKFSDDVIWMEDFWASAPAGDLFSKFGFTTDSVTKKIEVLLLK